MEEKIIKLNEEELIILENLLSHEIDYTEMEIEEEVNETNKKYQKNYLKKILKIQKKFKESL